MKENYLLRTRIVSADSEPRKYVVLRNYIRSLKNIYSKESKDRVEILIYSQSNQAREQDDCYIMVVIGKQKLSGKHFLMSEFQYSILRILKGEYKLTNVMHCAIWYHMYNLKNVKTPMEEC